MPCCERRTFHIPSKRAKTAWVPYDYNANNSKSRLSRLNEWESSQISVFVVPCAFDFILLLSKSLWQTVKPVQIHHHQPLTHNTACMFTMAWISENVQENKMHEWCNQSTSGCGNGNGNGSAQRMNGAENMLLSTYKYLLNAVCEIQ